MAVNLSPVGGVAAQFLDNNGNVLTGGKIYTYAAGTTTPQASYTSAAGTTAHSNPIILDASGRVPGGEIWLTDGLQYKVAIYTADNVLIGTYDNVIGINSNFVNFVTAEEVQIATAGQTVFTLTTMQYQPGTNNLVVYVDGVNQVEGGSYSFVETDSTTVTFTSGLHVGAVVKFVSAELLSTGIVDASSVVYTPAGTGAIPTNVQAKLRETVSVKDFGAVGDGVADDTAAIQAAINAVSTNSMGGDIYFPHGVYLVSATLLIQSDRIMLSGEGNKSVQIKRASDYGVTVKFSRNSTTQVVGGGVENIAFFDSNSSMTGATSPAHITLDNTNFVHLSNIDIFEGAGGLQLLTAQNTQVDTYFMAVYTGAPTGKNGIYIGPSNIPGLPTTIASIIWLNGIDMLLGTGIVTTTCMDYGINVENVDGLWITDCHIYNTAAANIRFGSFVGDQITNIYMNGMLLDHCAGYGLLMEGTSSIAAVEFSGRLSCLGAGGAGYHGIGISSPCQDIKIEGSIEGFKGSGIYIGNAAANDITICPTVIRNNDADNNGDGGIRIEQAQRVNINGGLIGGDGKQDYGIKIGSGVNKITVTGVGCMDNGGCGIQIENGSNYISIDGCNLQSNPLGGVIDNSSGNVKQISNCPGFTPILAQTTWNPGTINTLSQAANVIFVTGVSVNDDVQVSFSEDLTGLTPTAYCRNGIVVVLLGNLSGVPVTLPNMTVYMSINKKLA